MGRLASELSSENRVRVFKEKYHIPSNVGIRLAQEGEREPGTFPIIAIVECGLRFPLHHFLRLVMSILDLGPRSLTHNFYRIVNGVIEINQRYGFHISEWDLLYYYSIQKVRKDENRWYLKSRPEKALVHMLPDTIKAESDLCVVSGHWTHDPDEDYYPIVPLVSLGPGWLALSAVCHFYLFLASLTGN